MNLHELLNSLAQFETVSSMNMEVVVHDESEVGSGDLVPIIEIAMIDGKIAIVI